jgi:hypothetical protein
MHGFKRDSLMAHVSDVERWIDRLFIAAEGAELRLEDHRKAREVAAMLDEVGLAMSRFSKKALLVLVDAAAGKSYVGLLSAKLVFEPAGRNGAIITIEQDPKRVEASRRAAELLDSSIDIECRAADVDDDAAWPPEASIVTALHACGPAADSIIDRTIATRARHLLLVPCCTSSSIVAAVRAQGRAEALGIPHHAPVRRRFIQAVVDAERTLRLEAAGYETEVVEFVPPTVTPHNLLWRSRLVGETRRTAAARKEWAKLSAQLGMCEAG